MSGESEMVVKAAKWIALVATVSFSQPAALASPPPPVRLEIDANQPGPRSAATSSASSPSTSAPASMAASGSAPTRPIPNVRGIRSDVVAALRAIRVPNVRWPGGCFGDNYHWRNGIGPRAQRPRRLTRTGAA